MRNWLIGYYIVEFEQHGKDRAEYGSHLLKRLEERVNRKGLTRNLFQSARNFYLWYPQMRDNISMNNIITDSSSMFLPNHATTSHKLQHSDNEGIEKCTTVSCKFVTPGEKLISRLSLQRERNAAR